MRNNKQKGFSLIELLIVVAIILIIAAIAIPNLLRSKMAANEGSAVATLRTLNTSALLYSTTFSTLPPDLASMGPDASTGSTPTASGADLIDSVMAGGVAGAKPAAGIKVANKSGYTITYVPTGTPVTTYTLTAVPQSYNGTGFRSFFTDETGVIRANATGAAPTASVSSTPI